MITGFYGSFLHHLCGLVYEGENCPNGCAYCFANINGNPTCGNVNRAIRFLNKPNRKTYDDALFIEGFPICVSNKTDPFSVNNLRNTEMLFGELAKHKNGVYIQTKLRDGCEDIIDILGPDRTVVYVTITTMREDIRKIVEPNAPSTQQRLDIISRLQKRGYLVVVAVNPCNLTWLPPNDFKELVSVLLSIGVRHVKVEPLDMSRRRLAKLHQSRRERLLDAEKTNGIEDLMYCCSATEYMTKMGINVWKRSQPQKNPYFNNLKKVLGTTMPTIQGFVNDYCFERLADNDHITIGFPEFYEYMSSGSRIFRTSFKSNALRGYLLRENFHLWKENPHIHSFEHLFNVIWNSKYKIESAPWRHSLLYKIEKNGELVRDKNGDVVYYFDGKFKNDGKEVMVYGSDLL